VQVSIETHVLDVIREQLSRRQPVDGGSRNVIRTMTATCGYAEVRSLAAQRLEMWIQNPKVSTGVYVIVRSKVKVKLCIAVQHQLRSSPLRETRMPYGITQCYLPPDRGENPALTPS